MPTGDLFQLLNLAPDADAFAIEGAYRLLTRRFSRLPVPEAASEVRRIQAAYDLLTNPSQRAAYHKSPPPPPPFMATLHLSRPALPFQEDPQIIYGLVEVTATAQSAEAPAPAANLCLVIDRSTSMNGARLDQAKAGVNAILDGLRPEDTCSVIVFSDRAEAVVTAHKMTDEQRRLARSKVSLIRAGGGTEIMQGLLRGLVELHSQVNTKSISQLVLLTDGQTYGDETECQLLAALARNDGISIHALGIGDEWNDRFLDELAAATGGAVDLALTPEQVADFLRRRLNILADRAAERVHLEVLPDVGVELLEAFRFTPEPSPLAFPPHALALGQLPRSAKLCVLLKFRLQTSTEGYRPIARLSVVGDVAGPGARRARVTLDAGATVTLRPAPGEPPAPIVAALRRLSQIRLQERAFTQLQAGEVDEATRALTVLGTRLLAAGQSDLAKMAIAEARRIEQNASLSEEARKRIKYGTRALAGLEGWP
ncbi:MAG TPA: VWA domain-containing protein [Anaerolineales bacterium]|nr:VWA domain-containing protein [Anaerolineales bacterium]HRF46585.1 VWA domain-containing protein [Anaerolineales bacterium]